MQLPKDREKQIINIGESGGDICLSFISSPHSGAFSVYLKDSAIVIKRNAIFALSPDSPKGKILANSEERHQAMKVVLTAPPTRRLFIPSLKFEGQGGSDVEQASIFDGEDLRGEGELGWIAVHILLKPGETKVITVEVIASSGTLQLSLIDADINISSGKGAYVKVPATEWLPILGNSIDIVSARGMAPPEGKVLCLPWGAIKTR